MPVLSQSRPDPRRGDVVLILDGSGVVVYCAAPALRLFGRSAEDLVGKRASTVIAEMPPNKAIGGALRFEPFAAQGSDFFAVVLDPARAGKDGPPAPIETYRDLARMFDESQRFAHVGSFAIDAASGELRGSDELYRIFGIDPDAPADLDVALARVAAEERESVRAALQRATGGECPLDVRCTIVRPDGTERVLRVCAQLSTCGDAQCLVGSVLDITSDVAAERERIELAKELSDAKRMTSLGRVAATIAHEFNNVLAGIGTFSEYLLRNAEDDGVLSAATQISQAIRRGKTITDEILRYTRTSSPQFAPIDVRVWLEGFLPEASALTDGNTTIEARESRIVSGDVSQLNQVLVNLVVNARQASPRNAPIVIRATTAAMRDGTLGVDVAVIDQGNGIPVEISDRIFEPLFTTKRSGTGLGLALVEQIVRAHGGVVRVRSELGKGTEFHVLLPLVANVP